jgi:hypothetical protein
MRGDLLLLPDPRQQLSQLLPSEIFLSETVDYVSQVDGTGLSVPDQQYQIMLMGALEMVTVLMRNVSAYFPNFCSSRVFPAVLSAAALQLSGQVLLLAAVEWMRQYHSLSDEQQQLLQTPQLGSGGEAEVQARSKLMLADDLMCMSCQLLQQQLQQLWSRGHWQPSLQLLQQGGGEVLLLGLTLAVHCGSLDRQLWNSRDGLSLPELLLIVKPHCGVSDQSLVGRRDLFVSQLARKHPVAFFQFLDLCARSGRLDATGAIPVCQIAGYGCGRIGVRGLADLLSSPAATAALGSALCSILKLQLQHTMQLASQASISMEEPVLVAAHALTMFQLLGNMLHPAVCDALSLSADVSASSSSGSSSSGSSSSGSSSSGSSSSSSSSGSSSSGSSSSSRSQQCRASSVFLLVLACRGSLALHEAVATIRGAAESGLSPEATAAPVRTADYEAVHLHMVSTLQVLNNLLATLNVSQTRQPVAAAAAEDVQGATEDGSNSSQPVSWQHLLRLRDSRKLNAAFSAFGRKWTSSEADAVVSGASGLQVRPMRWSVAQVDSK